MKPTPPREALLERAFSDLPSQIGSIPLRRLSAGSFTLLGRLRNPMIVGSKTDAGADSSQEEMFEAVVQYVWVHGAELDAVLGVSSAEDVPILGLRKIAFEISVGEAFAFLASYQASALRMSASLTEVEPEESEDSGKPPESRPAGSPPSFTPAEPVATPSASVTSSGSCPSSELLPISMPPTSPTEPAANGACLTLLPDLAAEIAPPN